MSRIVPCQSLSKGAHPMTTLRPASLGSRILAGDYTVPNDTRVTGLNNNDLIIGPSGSGKTGGYIVPNLIHPTGSMIVTDTKGNLSKKYSEHLCSLGYQVHVIDFAHPVNSTIGWDPFDFVGYDPHELCYDEMKLAAISHTLWPDSMSTEPYWDRSTRTFLTALFAVSLDCDAPMEISILSALKYYPRFTKTKDLEKWNEWLESHPNSVGMRRMINAHNGGELAERTWGSTVMLAGEALAPLDFPAVHKLMEMREHLNFADLGHTPTVVFLQVSDTDRARDALVSLFYAQAIQELCEEADRQEDSALPVPVRILFDDFATNVRIADFDKIISVIRSRNISVSLILQSLSQLDTLYSEHQATTILNNCDHILYLGGHDYRSVEYVAQRSGISTTRVFTMPRDKAIMMESGQMGFETDKPKPYDSHTDTEAATPNPFENSAASNVTPRIESVTELPF